MNADSPRPARVAGRPDPTGPVCTLGLDLGTSSAKAVVADTGGRVLSSASAGYAVTSARAGYAESEPGHWWTAVTACAREAIHAAGAQPSAIGLSGQMHGLVLASGDGEALRPALLWADSRATGSLDAYRLLGADALARLANPLAPGMTGPLLKWVAGHEPRIYSEARWALQPKDWIRARLTGEFHAEPSDASASLLYDVLGDRWDLEVVSALGLETSLLAPLLPSAGALAGHLTAGAGTELGLPAGIPVAAGAADTAAAALGSGIVASGDIQLTVGTGAQVVRPITAPESRADTGINLYRSATPEGWYHMGATVSAGLSLNWVRETMNASWAELYASANHPGQAHDPVFLPHLSGERAPYCDPALRGSWTGLSLASDRTSLLRSALEGTAFAIRDALDALLGDHRPPHLRLAGGGTLAAGWRQMLADVLELPLHAVDVPAASGRGAALLGAHAAGLLSFSDIQGPLAPPARLVAEPDPAAAAFHTERHARFRHLVSALKLPRPPPGGPTTSPDRETADLVTTERPATPMSTPAGDPRPEGITRRLDRKLSNIAAGRYTPGDFVIADAKDADMAFGVACAGPVTSGPAGRHRTRAEYLGAMRALIAQGEIDILLASASNGERLAEEGALDDITLAIRGNDSTDIWNPRGGGYPAVPSRPFRTADLTAIRPFCDLVLYSLTFNNDLDHDLATLEAYRTFRQQAAALGIRYFLEVFNPNAPAGLAPDQVGAFVNDSIIRTLAGVTREQRPIFLKVAYNGSDALAELAGHDPSVVVGILGGSAGTTRDTFELLHRAERHGARVALFGRKIQRAESQLDLVGLLRPVVRGELSPADAVRAYHEALAKAEIAPWRTLEADLEVTDPVLRAE